MLWRCKRKHCYNCEIIADPDLNPKFCIINSSNSSIKQEWEADKMEFAAEKAKRTGDLSEYLKLRRELS